jgi:hypothetical protein
MDEMEYRYALNATREELRGVALELKERGDRTAQGDGHAMLLYAKATFWATMALSASEGDVKYGTEDDDVPVKDVAQTSAPVRTFAFEDRLYDLSKEYVDKDGDVWSFTGNTEACGMPLMKSNGLSPKVMARVVTEWGPLYLWSEGAEADTSGHTWCPTCDYKHAPGTV